MITPCKQLAFALLALLLGCSAEVGEGSAEINGGETTMTHPAAHAAVVLKTASGIPFCSGLQLPGGRTVLTAAHCLDSFQIDANTSSVPSEDEAAALTVASVTSLAGDTVAAGTYFLGSGSSAKGQAFMSVEPADHSKTATTMFSEAPSGSGINHVVAGPTGIIAAGWVGGRDNRKPALLRPNAADDAIVIQALDGLGRGVATALVHDDSTADGHYLVAGYTQQAGVDRAFLRKYDASGGLLSTPLEPSAAIAANLRIADLAVASDGTIFALGTQVRGSRRAILLRYPPSAAVISTEILAGNQPRFRSRALGIAADGAAIVLLDDGTSSLVYRVDGADARLMQTLDLGQHYSFQGFRVDLSGDGYTGFRARDMALDSAGRIIIVGEVRTDKAAKVAMIRLTSAGVPDNSFGSRGISIRPTLDTGTTMKSVGATAVAVAGDVIHVAGRGVGRRLIGRGPTHVLATSRHASTSSGSARGVVSAGGVPLGSVVTHATEDLAIITLSEPRETPADYVLPSPEALSIGDLVTCIGMASMDLNVHGTLSQGEFRVVAIYSTVSILRGTGSYEAVRGDSGGACFSASGAISGVMARALRGSKPDDLAVAVAREQVVDAFITANTSNP